MSQRRGPLATDLQHNHEEKEEVGHSLELFKQHHGQEGQGGVLVAAHHIVLETNRKTGWLSNQSSGYRGRRRGGAAFPHASYRLSPPAEAQEGLLLFVSVVLTAIGPHLPSEACEVRARGRATWEEHVFTQMDPELRPSLIYISYTMI